MNYKNMISSFVLFMWIFSGIVAGQNQVKADRVFSEGEFLQYKVSYLFLRVGTLKMQNMGYMQKYGYTGNYVKIYVDSNPSIPFVTIHDLYETVMNEKAEPIYFLAHEDKGDYILKTIYNFDYDQDSIHMYEAKVDKNNLVETVTMDSSTTLEHNTYRDAISLLFFARKFSSNVQKDKDVYTIALAKKEKCFFQESGEQKEVKIKGEELPTYYVEGNVKFIGIAGIKDGFKGWFSLDDQRVPLQAKMKAFFGSVKIELEAFDNWESPLADRLRELLPGQAATSN